MVWIKLSEVILSTEGDILQYILEPVKLIRLLSHGSLCLAVERVLSVGIGAALYALAP